MKKTTLILFIVLSIVACGRKDNGTKEYLIVDQANNKIINKYEYTEDSNELVKTSSYTTSEEIEKEIDYEYDSKGFLVKTIEKVYGQPSKTVTYETKTEYDSAGRLVKLIRTSSKGEVVETNFGYDETGTLRGVVEKDAKGNLLMQDY